MERDGLEERQAGPVLVADVVKAPDGTVCDQCPDLGRTAAAVVAVSLNVGSLPRFLCAACWPGKLITLYLHGYELRC